MANVLNLTLDRRGGTPLVYLGGAGEGVGGVGAGRGGKRWLSRKKS